MAQTRPVIAGSAAFAAALDAGELVLLEVEGASEPGPWCRLTAHALAAPTVRVRLSVPPSACPLSAGQRVWAQVRELHAADYGQWIPGSMHPHQLARRLGVDAVAELERIWPAGDAEPGIRSAYWAAIASLRHRAWDASRGSTSRSFVAAVTLGLGRSLPGDQRAHLREAGLGHLLAVSGLHVGIAALLVRGLLLRIALLLGNSPRTAALLSCLPVLAYVGLTGASPSAVRAAAMFLLLQAAVAVGRPAHGMTQLLVAAAVLLALYPWWALSPGFQLSVTAMAVIVHPATPAGLWRQSVSVVWATAPVALWHFGTVSLYGILANCLAIPVFTLWVVPLGLLGVSALPWAGSAALDPAALGATLVLDVSAVFARLPVLSPRVLIGVAGVLVIARASARYLGERVEARAHVCGIPPVAAGLAVIVVGTLQLVWAPKPSTELEAWIAVGRTREVAVIARVKNSGSDLPRAACIRDPVLSPTRWPQLLESIGVDTVVRVETSRASEGPHVVALRQLLRRRGFLGRAEASRSSCLFPSREQARAAIKRCQQRAERRGGRGPVTARVGDDGALACFFEQRWIPVHSDAGVTPDAQRRGGLGR